MPTTLTMVCFSDIGATNLRLSASTPDGATLVLNAETLVPDAAGPGFSVVIADGVITTDLNCWVTLDGQTDVLYSGYLRLGQTAVANNREDAESRAQIDASKVILDALDTVKPANAPTVDGTGRVTTSNPTTGGGVDHTAELSALQMEIDKVRKYDEPYTVTHGTRTETFTDAKV